MWVSGVGPISTLSNHSSGFTSLIYFRRLQHATFIPYIRYFCDARIAPQRSDRPNAGIYCRFVLESPSLQFPAESPYYKKIIYSRMNLGRTMGVPIVFFGIFLGPWGGGVVNWKFWDHGGGS